jgi:hypothetical protein
LSRIRSSLLALVLMACTPGPAGYVVQGRVALDTVTSSVDSELAAYYVTHYLAGHGTDPARDRRVEQLLAPYRQASLSTELLVRLARASSNDFAALYFAQRVTEEHTDIKERFLRYATSPEAGELPTAPYVVVFVPGLFYQTHLETKGDLRDAERLVQSLGMATDRVAVADADTVEANARRIAEFLVNRPDDGRKLILVSASMGGPEVLYALGKLVPPPAAERVRAWVSIGGVLRGSPVADRYLDPPRSWFAAVAGWWMGFPCDMVASLSTTRSLARLAETAIPSHIKILHYVAVPLTGTVTKEVRDPFEVMQAYGPSDGLTLLTDELLPGGVVIADVGLDHRYADPRIEAKTAALTRVVLDMLEDSQL